ncbi:orotidine-5'-phosphate decarboxylase [Georgenia halophila]|uniref:Orotidine 5'-phosphate decarboxylase n=1 Tax=Georgenia halophila TaxID=620889 RepID=A0ABP8L7M5_9MICO
MTPFGDRLAAAMDAHGPVCVGIDPHPSLLASWGLDDEAEGLRRFGLAVVEELGGRVAALKPQSAFFERHGAAGVAALEDVLAAARDTGTLTILDVKRGDIGSTMTGYAEAYLGDRGPLRADAVTLSPYLGLESLRPALDLARRTGRGVFVLALTSNPEAAAVQHARHDGVPVAAQIADGARAENAAAPGERLGSVGLVVGATTGSATQDLGLDLAGVGGPLLAPGVGAQGAGAAELAQVFGRACGQVLASTSRTVLQQGPGRLHEAAAQVVEEVRAAMSA